MQSLYGAAVPASFEAGFNGCCSWSKNAQRTQVGLCVSFFLINATFSLSRVVYPTSWLHVAQPLSAGIFPPVCTQYLELKAQTISVAVLLFLICKDWHVPFIIIVVNDWRDCYHTSEWRWVDDSTVTHLSGQMLTTSVRSCCKGVMVEGSAGPLTPDKLFCHLNSLPLLTPFPALMLCHNVQKSGFNRQPITPNDFSASVTSGKHHTVRLPLISSTNVIDWL